jgi:hypothetical protein
LRIVALDEVQQRKIETIEHGRIVPNFGARRINFARGWQSAFKKAARSSARQRECVR